MAAKTKKNSAKKSVKKSEKKPAAKAAKATPKAKVKAKAKSKPVAKKPVAKSAPKSAAKKSKAPAAKAKSAGKTVVKASAKAKASKSSAGKTIAKFAGAAAAVGAIAGVAFAKVKVASKSKTNVSDFFSPLDDRVIIEETKAELRTAGGLFIPDTVVDEVGPKEGIILAVGPGHRSKKGHMRPLDVKKGDTVVYDAYAGSPLKIGDRDVTMLRESELLGVKND